MDEPMSSAMLDRIEAAYCDANMKCDDDTGLYDVQPDCKARQAAARVWLTVCGVGLLLDEVRRLTAERDAIIKRIDGLNDGESLLDAIGFVVDEWEHFGRELQRAVDETIPRLTAERDAARQALAEAERREQELRGAVVELVDSLDSQSEWQSGPTQAQYDRQTAALTSLRALLAAAPATAEPVDGGA